MKLIQTTATAVEKLKIRAKLLKQTEKINHAEALYRAAEEAGYDDWHHVVWCQEKTNAPTVSPEQTAGTVDPYLDEAKAYMDYLASRATVEVKLLPLPSGNIFHAVEIEGQRFRGGIAIGGPYVARMVGRYDSAGDVSLGVSAIHFTNQDISKRSAPPDWWVCKYGPNQQRIHIGMLSSAGRHAFAREFGLIICPSSDPAADQLRGFPKEAMYRGNEGRVFYLSPAFQALKRWAQKHPRKAKQFSQMSHYLHNWLERAQQQ